MALSPADHAEIQNLLGKYNFAIDFGDADGWADCFTADGVFDSPMNKANGRDELLAFAKQFAGMGAVRHWVTNTVVDGDGDSATTKCYLILYQLAKEGPKSLATAVYNDRLKKDGGKWKFTERKVLIDSV